VAESVRLHDSIVTAGALFRRTVVEQIGGWDPRLRYCPDWDFWMRASSLGQFRRLREPLAQYRWHDQGISWRNRGPDMLRERIELIDSVYDSDSVSEELMAVRAQAYRNAYICAGAYSAGPGVNEPGERFYIGDRLWRQTSDVAEDAEAQLAEMAGHLRRLEDARERDQEHIHEIREHIRAVEKHRDELIGYLNRPWWWHLARSLTPSRLRPWVKRLRRTDRQDAHG
jgi:hypothetical protein